jgi:hypothetical protein
MESGTFRILFRRPCAAACGQSTTRKANGENPFPLSRQKATSLPAMIAQMRESPVECSQSVAEGTG